MIVQFIIFLDCTSDAHIWDTELQTCVCEVDYYQTAEGNQNDPPTCTPCPDGTTTNGGTNSDVCSCKYGQRIIHYSQIVLFYFPTYSDINMLFCFNTYLWLLSS